VVATRRIASREAQLRKLVLRMQTVLDMRRQLQRYQRNASQTMLAIWLDIEWRVMGARIVDEMRRVEGGGNGRAA